MKYSNNRTLQGIHTVGMFNYNPASIPSVEYQWPLVMGSSVHGPSPRRRWLRSTGQIFDYNWQGNPAYDPSFNPPTMPPLFIMGRRWR